MTNFTPTSMLIQTYDRTTNLKRRIVTLLVPTHEFHYDTHFQATGIVHPAITSYPLHQQELVEQLQQHVSGNLMPILHPIIPL